MMQEVPQAPQQRAIAKKLLRQPKQSLQSQERQRVQHSPLPQGCLPLGNAPWTMPSLQSWIASSRIMCALRTVSVVALHSATVGRAATLRAADIPYNSVWQSCIHRHSPQPRDVAGDWAAIPGK